MDFTKEIKQREFLRFIAPLLVSSMFSQVYTMINTFIVSRYQTYEAVAVMGACTAFTSLYDFTISGLTSGFVFYIGNCIGSKEKNRFQKGFWGAVYFACVIGLVGILISIFINPILDFARVQKEIRSRAALYSSMIFWGGMWSGLKNILFCTIQNLGDVRFPAVVSMTGTVTNTILMIFLVKGLQLDVYASSLSLMLNNVFLCLWMSLYLYKKYKDFIGIKFPCEIEKQVGKELLKNGFGKASMMAFISLGTVIMQRSINTLSLELIAADTYAENILNVWVELLAGFGTTAMIMTAQNSRNVKAGHYKKMMKILILNSMSMSVLGILFGYFGMPYVLQLIAGTSVDSAICASAILWFRIASIGFIGLTFLLVGRNALHSMGKWQMMPILGGVGLLCNIFCAMFVPRYGILSIAGAYILKWGVPGMIAYFVFLRQIGGWNAGK